jgi:hypothetical protein
MVRLGWFTIVMLAFTDQSYVPLDSVVTFVAAYRAAGYDFLKVRRERLPIFDSVVAAARRVGIPVVGHKPWTVPLERALTGMRSIEHPTGSQRLRIVVGCRLSCKLFPAPHMEAP